jgi:hypothetical protein
MVPGSHTIITLSLQWQQNLIAAVATQLYFRRDEWARQKCVRMQRWQIPIWHSIMNIITSNNLKSDNMNCPCFNGIRNAVHELTFYRPSNHVDPWKQWCMFRFINNSSDQSILRDLASRAKQTRQKHKSLWLLASRLSIPPRQVDAQGMDYEIFASLGLDPRFLRWSWEGGP